MKTGIASVDVFPLHAPLDHAFHWSRGTAFARDAVLVSIATESGLTGWGEALAPETASVIRDALIPELTHLDVLKRGDLLQRLHGAAARSGVRAAVAAESVGAVDVALWDLAARVMDRPLCDVLAEDGHDHAEVYASSIYYGENHSLTPATEAANWMKQGFSGVKIKVGRAPLAEDIARVESVRCAIGPGTPLMLDANQICDLGSALELVGALARLNVMWLEEPFASHDVAAYRALKRSVSQPIATGENLHAPEEFMPFIDERLVDFVQPNVARVGGLSAALSVVQAASQSGLRVAVHHWGTPIGLAASLHLACCVPPHAPMPAVEVDLSPNPLRNVAPVDWLRPEDGKLTPPPGPGLGIVPQLDALAKYHVALT